MLLQRQAPALRGLPSANLTQTMSLLGMPADELRQYVERALADNPALELLEQRRCPSCGRGLGRQRRCLACTPPPAASAEQPVVFLSERQDFYEWRSGSRSSGSAGGHGAGTTFGDPDGDALELLAAPDNLAAYVLRQVGPELAAPERRIAAYLLAGLDEDGLLEIELGEAARYLRQPPSRIEAVLRRIQRSEPLGVGARSPLEAMQAQLEALTEQGQTGQRLSVAQAAAARRMLADGLELLGRRHTGELARKLGLPPADAEAAAAFIRANLNPYPARAHWGGSGPARLPEQALHTPDVLFWPLESRPDAPLVVEVNAPLAGRLAINPLFRQAMTQTEDPNAAERWKSDLEQAALLVKCLEQRNQTIVRLVQRLAVEQRAFILHGEAHLRPLTRARLADELQVHESTISRAVAGKCAQLPNGRLILLEGFFDRSLAVRVALRQIIANAGGPLSDSDLARRLGEAGYPVARRTVAKYRAMEGIGSMYFREEEQG